MRRASCRAPFPVSCSNVKIRRVLDLSPNSDITYSLDRSPQSVADIMRPVIINILLSFQVSDKLLELRGESHHGHSITTFAFIPE